MAREISAVAPVLAAAEKEDLDTGLAGNLVRGDHVCVDDTRNVNILVALDQRQGTDAVPDQGRCFKVENLCSGLHLSGQSLLDVVASAGQEDTSLLDQRGIVRATDSSHARGA